MRTFRAEGLFDSTVAETSYGKVRGCRRGGVYCFKGVPYGASATRWRCEVLHTRPPRSTRPDVSMTPKSRDSCLSRTFCDGLASILWPEKELYMSRLSSFALFAGLASI